jgi:hypothetical protein
VANPAEVVLADDDRPVTVNDVTVNEGSPYAVFTVDAREDQYVRLSLGSTSTGNDATLGADTGAVQYWNGTAWADYQEGLFVRVPADGDTQDGEAAPLLVRVKIAVDDQSDNGETFTLSASNTGGKADQGLGTIKDDGTGTLFLSGLDDPAVNGIQNPSGVGPDGLPQTVPAPTTPVVDPARVVVPDDDRPVLVNSATVNEASPFMVFTVTARQGQLVGLSAASDTASVGTDTGTALEVWNGTQWTPYSTGTLVRVPGSDPTVEVPLLVRVAVRQDPAFEGAERITLTATNSGGRSATGTGTIVDDGTGDLYATRVDDPATPGNESVIGVGPDGLPLLVADPVRDDDRPLSVNSLVVDEASRHAVFTVTCVQGQPMTLTLASGTADVGTDTGSALEYWDGDSWESYRGQFTVPGSTPNATVDLLVRVAITADTELEVSQDFTLTARYTAGALRSSTGLGTIVDAGQGTGTIFVTDDGLPGVNPNGTPATRIPVTTPVAAPDAVLANDDRPVTVNDVEVNEASPFLVWTVGAKQGQYVRLALGETGSGDGHALLGTDTGTQLQYWSGSVWLDYTPDTYVKIPGGNAGADGQMLVRLAVLNDFRFEDRETLTLSATNTGGVSAVGEGAIRDDGKGLLFGPANIDPRTPDTQEALGLQVLDDDRVAPPLAEPPPPPAAPIEAIAQPTAPALHVQRAVQEGRESTSSVGGQSMLAAVAGRGSGLAGDGLNIQRRLDALIDKFDRPTDPNLYVLPEVKDTRSQSYDVKAPAIELQSGILFEPSSSSGSLPSIFVVAQADGESAEPQTLADAELQRLVAAPAESGAQPWWVLAEREAAELEEARVRHLAAIHPALQAADGRSPGVDRSGKSEAGQMSFSAKLKAGLGRAVRGA